MHRTRRDILIYVGIPAVIAVLALGALMWYVASEPAPSMSVYTRDMRGPR